MTIQRTYQAKRVEGSRGSRMRLKSHRRAREREPRRRRAPSRTHHAKDTPMKLLQAGTRFGTARLTLARRLRHRPDQPREASRDAYVMELAPISGFSQRSCRGAASIAGSKRVSDFCALRMLAPAALACCTWCCRYMREAHIPTAPCTTLWRGKVARLPPTRTNSLKIRRTPNSIVEKLHLCYTGAPR